MKIHIISNNSGISRSNVYWIRASFILILVILLEACSGGGSSGGKSSIPQFSSPPVRPYLVKGVYATSGSNNPDVLSHPQLVGVLVRVAWSSIEPSPGAYDFSSIDYQISGLKSAGKKWSLAVLGGPHSPAWLYSSPYNVATLNISYFGSTVTIPAFWDNTLQARLSALAQAVSTKYADDDSLRLVYLPQMSANGVEGHFNGTSDDSLRSQGFSEDLWVNSVLEAARSFASTFPNKPVAIELHYILSSASAGNRIMKAIESDSSLQSHVGVAMWWLSGKTDYQSDLLTAFASFNGSLYAQLIDKSANASSFLNRDYSTAFSQAMDLKIKYIEPWPEDFTSRKWDSLFDSFNFYANQ